ncbi:hypothetical protein [Rhodothalassium salexigens]|uniref:hypothetical protein n=1 Tax=Rhodothalassium salexigens TaxID=1086 RepID=UPI001913C96F|nr:hypothetical protein [Rhodothalassium salexigens]
MVAWKTGMKMGLGALGVAGAVALLAGRVDAGALSAAESLRLAEQALERGQVDRALTHGARAALRGEDRRVVLGAQSVLCLGHLRQGAGASALKACSAVADARPDDWRALNNRGIARYQTGDYAGAAADYRAALAAGGPAKMLDANLALAEKQRMLAQR